MNRRAGRVESTALAQFAHTLRANPPAQCCNGAKRSQRGRLEVGDLRNGLAQLVLALVKLLHELLERQALRRIDAGTLSAAEVERIGLALMRQTEQIAGLCEYFGLTGEDLNLDIGPLGKLF